ncbi:MAG: hypothetical protein WC686_01805 [Candidatus Shapirobacteria bacterium]|jgi:hypothetical protein
MPKVENNASLALKPLPRLINGPVIDTVTWHEYCDALNGLKVFCDYDSGVANIAELNAVIFPIGEYLRRFVFSSGHLETYPASHLYHPGMEVRAVTKRWVLEQTILEPLPKHQLHLTANHHQAQLTATCQGEIFAGEPKILWQVFVPVKSVIGPDNATTFKASSFNPSTHPPRLEIYYPGHYPTIYQVQERYLEVLQTGIRELLTSPKLHLF